VDFRAVQHAFTAHLRDPEHVPGPDGLEDRRIRIYRDLIFNNLDSLLSSAFPVLRQILGESGWRALIRRFLVRHRAQSPLFTELPEELLSYLRTERGDHPEDPPFMLELAHYEWVELALQISDDEPDLTDIDPDGDLLTGQPTVSPLAWPLSYRFPVHRIAPDFQPAEPPAEPTHLVVYRTRDDAVAFLETNAVTQRLLQLLQENPARSGQEHLNEIARELGHPAPEQVIAFGARLLDDLHAKGVILGTRRTPA
jgi:hypothetical protein